MTVTEICKAISTTLSRNLRKSTEDERQQQLSLALLDIGKKVIPALNQLLTAEGESPNLLVARTAALDLLTFVCIDFNRSCTNYRWGISCLEELSANCQEPQMKKKLVIYTNQLKKKWNESEPGGIMHNPRAARFRRPGSSSIPSAILFVLMLGCALFIMLHFNLTPLVFPRWQESRIQARQTEMASQQSEASIPPVPVPSQEQAPPPPVLNSETSDGSFYSFMDSQGVVHLVDDLAKVPEPYRQTMKVTPTSKTHSVVTPVIIKGNQVIVPVNLSLRGRSVDAKLLLDTGASMTTISGRLATQLGVLASEVKSGTIRVADGRSVDSAMFWLDSISVGSTSMPHIQTSILAGSGSEGHDGLLGMNFLKNFRYHIDFNRSVIEWGR